MMSLAMVGSLVVLLFLGVPVAVSIAFAAIVGLLLFTSTPPLIVIQQFFVSIDSFPLVAIPLFILAGNIMETGGVSRRLLNVAKSMVGHLPGGLAATCVLTCLIFGAVSGSSVATTFAIGSIIIPAMVSQKYPIGFAAALQATSAELAVIIPPSVPMILYGVATGTSIGDLFIAGIGPGFLIAGALLATVVIWSLLRNYKPDEDRVSFGRAALDGILALLLPVIIMGGIYGGVFTPTEAAVSAVFYALLLAGPVYRELGFRQLFGIVRKSAISTSFIMFTIAAAGLFSYLLNISGGGVALTNWINSTFTSSWSFLLAVNIALFFVGMIVETSVAILVLGPLFAPIAVGMGIDPVHFGLIMIVNLALGMITPPVGVNLFAACAVARIPLQTLVPYLLPFIAVVIVCLALITYVPALSVGILHLLRS
ncbi:TRAP transporter large permease [Chelatococcus sp. GCM10030263]|uniref:TRAP transporter large permease n=1 Tax=Chelatococcus sp. GCM10030263 TaxID=3273387 RepID=UPI00360E5F7C